MTPRPVLMEEADSAFRREHCSGAPGRALAVLIVDDCAGDARLEVLALEEAGYRVGWQRVEDASGMAAALEVGSWDVVLCEHQMVGFDSLGALEVREACASAVPLIVVHSQHSEESGAPAIGAGAAACVSKRALVRLGAVVGMHVRGVDEQPKLEVASGSSVEELCVRNLLANPAERVFFKDREGRFLLVSTGLVAALGQGRSLEQVIGKTDFDLFSRQHAEAAFEDDQRVMSSGEPIIGKVQRETFADRPDVWVTSTKLPLRDEHGQIIGTWGISRDITEHHRIEAEQVRLASIVAAANEAIVSIDMSGRVTSWNDGAEAILGYRADEMLGNALDSLLPESPLEGSVAVSDHALVGQTSDRVETQRVHKDGSLVDVAVTAFPLFGREGRQTGAGAIIRDIRESVRQARELAASEQRYREILERAPDGVARIDSENRIDYVNARMAEMLGYTVEEMLGQPFGKFIDPERRQIATRILEHDRNRGAGRTMLEGPLLRTDGQLCWTRISSTVLVDHEGTYTGTQAIVSDITEVKLREEELRSSERFASAVADSMAEGMFAVDPAGRLTYMNDAAERMLGWSEEELRGRSMHEVTHSVRKNGLAFPVEECPLMTVRTTGVAVHVEDDAFVKRGGELLPVSYSSSALDSDQVSGAVVVFHDITESKTEELRVARELEALNWVGRIRDALDEDRFVLYAQPIIELRTGAVTQHELLIRMLDRDGVLIAPSSFLPTAERFGLIEEIDDWVIGQAARLIGEGHAVALQFNLSGRSVGHADLGAKIQSAVREHGGDPDRLVCEITETALLEHAGVGEAFVRELNAFGCHVALDDFGTGYGGFTYLKRLPVSYLKIDIEFVRDLAENLASQHVVAAIVSLAQGFGQQTIAEGVEDEHTLELLKEMGVDFAQGYAIARPAPVDEVLKPAARAPEAKEHAHHGN